MHSPYDYSESFRWDTYFPLMRQVWDERDGQGFFYYGA